ncbi:MAG: tRNA lysidine(34) synthetase TilS [Clostridia bacterium]|nr:tRNA lysidine(34) synthetase TilS [Clostridia bacterium]
MKKDKREILLRNIREFYSDGEKTLVGFSGGADSVTLLHILLTFLGKERVCAVHINHMLRGKDADADEEFCRSFCETYEIPFRSVRIDVQKLCGGKGFEETARDIRYRVFEETAKQMDCTTVSLAHTASDNLETMIFHLCRGAGASGLSGIPMTRPLGDLMIVRPLLDLTREEIIAYTEEHGLPFCTDATNADTAYTRNFIRAEIVPLLKKVNPSAEENARHASQSIAELHCFAEVSANAFLHEREGLFVSDMAELADPVLYAVLDRSYRQAGGDTLPRTQANALQTLIRRKKTGASVSLSGGITAKLDGDFLHFFQNDVENDALTAEIPLHFGENRLSENSYLYIGTAPTEHFRFSAHAKIPEHSLPTLFARPRNDGESYRFGGMTRKLKKILCGKTLAEKNRPLICDADGILWFPGFPIADGKHGEIPIYYIEY